MKSASPIKLLLLCGLLGGLGMALAQDAADDPAASPAPATDPAIGSGPSDVTNTDTPPPGTEASEERTWLNAQDAGLLDIVKMISKMTGRNFILDDQIKNRKITILAQRPMTKGEAYQAFLSALNVSGFTVVEGPGEVYKIVPLANAKKFPIPTHVDTTPISDAIVTRLVTLNNVGAADMRQAIGDMISPGGAINVYAQTNTLIITDSGQNIDRLLKIIKELDQEGPQQVMEIVPVRHAQAKDLANMVNQLFDKQKQDKQKSPSKPGDPVDIDEVSKLIPDERTNAIIVLASKRALDQVRQIIAKLDRKLDSGEEGKIHVHYLKFAKAKELAQVLSTLTQEAGKPAAKGGQASAEPAMADFDGGIKITADEGLNALIVTSSYKDYKTLVERVISFLDQQRRQVYLEAVVMELKISNGGTVGFKGHGGIGGSMLGFGQTFGAAAELGGVGALAAPGLLGGLISQRTVNINTVGTNGTSQSVSIPAFSAFLNSVSTYADFNIVSTPNILTLDNQEASISVENQIPIPGAQTLSTTGLPTIAPVTYEKAGLTLKIKPQIGFGDVVNLDIEQELSSFGATNKDLRAPEKTQRKVKSVVLCQDGQTVVIGGLMQDEIKNSKSKIPILGDIPLLGFFFSEKTRSADKSNLLIFITPHIVRDSTDFSEILQRKIDQRNQFIQDNYGKKQQQIIKDAIKTHREDLLEFTEQPLPAPSAASPKWSTTNIGNAPAASRGLGAANAITQPEALLHGAARPAPVPSTGKSVPAASPPVSASPTTYKVTTSTAPIISVPSVSPSVAPPSATPVGGTGAVPGPPTWWKKKKKPNPTATRGSTSSSVSAPIEEQALDADAPAPNTRKSKK